MASYFNIFAGVLCFLGSSVLAYGLYNPAMDFIKFYPLELFVIAGSMWVGLIFFAIVYMPFVLLVSDDVGG